MRRPYSQLYDNNDTSPVGGQLDSPLTTEFVTTSAENVRSVIDSVGRIYRLGDAGVAPRGTKRILWSSEGYNYRGIAVPALTTAQKKTSGSITTNISAAPSKPGFTIPANLDFSSCHYLSLVVILSALSGGTSPSIQFELDFLDDTPSTPGKFAVWNPAALTAAGNNLVQVGPAMSVPPSTAPTGYANSVVPSNWTVYSIPYVVLPQGTFSWTVTGSPTTCAWTAWLYGQY